MPDNQTLTKSQQWYKLLGELRAAVKELDDAAGEVFNIAGMLDELTDYDHNWQNDAFIDISDAEQLLANIEAEGDPFDDEDDDA